MAWLSEWQLKRLGEPGLIPDAIVQLQVGAKRKTFALEVDRGGEPAQKVFTAKLRTYVALRGRGDFVPDALLVVTTTTRRLYALLEAAAREPGAADFLFTVRDKTSQEQVLGKIWTSPRLAFAESTAEGFVSLLDLFNEEGRNCHE